MEVPGFTYPDLDSPQIEAVLVVTDDEDRPVMAIAAERIVQLYMWCPRGGSPHRKIFGLRLLHEAMAKILGAMGYRSVEAFISPDLAHFGRRLEKTFGWRKNWPSWTRRFLNG